MPPQRDRGVCGGLRHVVALALLRVRAVHPTRGRAEDGAERLGKSLACHRSWWLGAPHPRKTPEPSQLGTFHQDLRAVAVQPLGTAGQLVKQSEGKGWVLPKHACFPGEAEQPALQRQREGWWQRGNEEVAAEEGVTLLRPAELSRRLGDLKKKKRVRVSSSKRLFPSAPSLSLAEIRAARLI